MNLSDEITDWATLEVLKGLPILPVAESNMNKMQLCRVYIDELRRLNIFPGNGGWIGVELKHLLIDLAPFSD